ncbi:hypothetical protein [Burkholderia pseudomallei]|uniref:hypothetical protein n=1 Tax=Burkholderia pseudomallei TaxID=28450 RepID=UPI0015E139C9|nr:hypothetical protein [Burkholderia pseudomallei]
MQKQHSRKEESIVPLHQPTECKLRSVKLNVHRVDAERSTHQKMARPDLHEKHVVVVVGEAGIGKKTEFKDEMERLRTQGKVAA